MYSDANYIVCAGGRPGDPQWGAFYAPHINLSITKRQVPKNFKWSHPGVMERWTHQWSILIIVIGRIMGYICGRSDL